MDQRIIIPGRWYIDEKALAILAEKYAHHTIHQEHRVFASHAYRQAIHLRLDRYKTRLADEYKIRKKKDIESLYISHQTEISEYMESISPGDLQIGDIAGLHTLLFPKGLYGITLTPE